MSIKKGPHILKKTSIFAMFCLSYLPLFFLLATKILMESWNFLNYSGINWIGFIVFLERFSFIFILHILTIYAIIGTSMTFKKIETLKSNSFPITVQAIKSKNNESLSYLATYVIPLITQSQFKIFELITFIVLFTIYFLLYASSSMIVINPILNIIYGLYEVDFQFKPDGKIIKDALLITKTKYIEEDSTLQIIKLSHRIYFAY